jgi:hypothetical protein
MENSRFEASGEKQTVTDGEEVDQVNELGFRGRNRSSPMKTSQTLSKFVVILLRLGCVSVHRAPTNYIERLKDLRGTPYLTLGCARYVETARQIDWYCDAATLYSGCYGRASIVTEFPTKHIDRSRIGRDVLVFHGIHAVAYTGEEFIGSDPIHNDIATIDLDQTNPSDRWYGGPVRVLRWRYPRRCSCLAQKGDAVRFAAGVSSLTPGQFKGSSHLLNRCETNSRGASTSECRLWPKRSFLLDLFPGSRSTI